jgi:hypothetical protein
MEEVNALRLNGYIASDIRMGTNRKKGCPQVSFLLDVPFSHPYEPVSENYRARLRTNVDGDNAEWIYDNLYEGAHIEIRQGFLRTWYVESSGKSYYQAAGFDIERERCGDVPEDYVPHNEARFSGRFIMQWVSEETSEGIKRVGLRMAATPNFLVPDTNYDTCIGVILYAELAEKVDGRLKPGNVIDYLEGSLKSFYNGYQNTWGVYVIANKIDF